MSEIICIGSSSKDIFFPVEGGVIFDTPEDLTSQKKLAFELGAKFQADEIYEAVGGCAANVAQGLARLGISVNCYTKIGKDHLGKWIKKELKKERVGVKLLQVDGKCKSDLSAIVVDVESREHLIFFNRDANSNLEIKKRKLSGTRNIFVSALNGDWEKHFDDIMEVTKKKNIDIFFNPGQRNIRDNSRKIAEMVSFSKIVILNKDEAIEIISKTRDIEKEEQLNDEIFLLKEIMKAGAEIVALTDGENGAWVADKDEMFFARPIAKDIVDTLGAGDAFSSGFIGAFLNGKSLEKSLRWGMANSLNVLKYYGAKEGLLKKNEIEESIINVKAKGL